MAPYHPALPPRGLAYNITPYKIGRPTDKNFIWGVASLGWMIRKAPVRTEPHPTIPRCLRVASHITLPPIKLAGQLTRISSGGRVARDRVPASRNDWRKFESLR